MNDAGAMRENEERLRWGGLDILVDCVDGEIAPGMVR